MRERREREARERRERGERETTGYEPVDRKQVLLFGGFDAAGTLPSIDALYLSGTKRSLAKPARSISPSIRSALLKVFGPGNPDKLTVLWGN